MALTEQQVVPKAAADLGLPEPMLYGWRAKKRYTGQTFEDQKLQQAEMARLKRDNARLEKEVAFLKKRRADGRPLFCEATEVKYALINQHETAYPVHMMCRLLSVPSSSYYDWKKRPESPREQANQRLTADIKRLFDDEKGRAGSPRLTRSLHAEGKPVTHKRVARIMRANGWRAKAARKFKATINSKHNLPVAPNLLQQDFSAESQIKMGNRHHVSLD